MTTFTKENNVLFTPYIFPDTQKYLLHFECSEGQENCPIHTLIKRTSLVIPTATVIPTADSLNTCFVCNVMSECWSMPLAICKLKKQENDAVWTFETIYTFTFDT